MRSGVRNTPQTDPVSIHVIAQGGIGNGVDQIVNLFPGINMLARFALAVAEISVIEGHRGEPGIGEKLGIFGLDQLDRKSVV